MNEISIYRFKITIGEYIIEKHHMIYVYIKIHL